MPKLSLKSENSGSEVEYDIYSLAFKNFHEKVEEIKGSNTVELEKGSYKVRAETEDKRYEKVVLLDGDMTVNMDFADKYGEIQNSGSGLKGAIVGIIAVIVIGVLGYFIAVQQGLI